ncbi:MAG: hypothetical protein HDS31_01870 [Bacteroides sp.]|nr:hypothetical protein [Bacteroides sp.]
MSKKPTPSDIFADFLAEACTEVLREARQRPEVPESLRTETDGLTPEAIEEMRSTPEYLKFKDEYKRRIRELAEFVNAHQKKYNCTLFLIGAIDISITSTGGANCITSTTISGRNDAVEKSIIAAMNDKNIANLLIGQAKKVMITKLMNDAMFTDDGTSDGETTGEPDSAEPTSDE